MGENEFYNSITNRFVTQIIVFYFRTLSSANVIKIEYVMNSFF